MDTVSIIGTGTMGKAIAGVVRAGGRTAELIGKDDMGKAPTGDVVVLAVPYPAIPEVLAAHGENLAGKVVVDVTNPLDFTTFDSLTVPADSSAAQEIAAAVPGARVVKAFNTTFAATLAAGMVGDAVTTVLIAGDDARAKALLAEIVTDAGLRAVDAGALRRARELEALGFLQITLGASGQVPWDGGFAVVA